jgi:WD40 repeat protein
VGFLDFFGPTRFKTWDFRSEAESRVITEDIMKSRQNASFTPDGSEVVFLDQQRNVVAFDPVSGQRTRAFPTLDSALPGEWPGEQNLLLSPHGARVAVVSVNRRSVDVWEMKSGRLLIALPERAAGVAWLSWSPDNQRLAVSRSTGEVAIWDLAEAERVLTGLGLSP